MRYEEKMRLPVYFATQDGSISIAAIVNIVQQVSENQLTALGEGMKGLAEYGAGWVITQSHIQITRTPRAEEPVTVWTEANSYNRLLTYRDYGIDDTDGNALVRVTSTWVMIDLEKRKLIPIIEEAVQGVGAKKDPHVKRLPRVAKIDTVTGSKPYQVRYFDIDPNRHVNNVHYFDWMLDALGDDWLLSHRPREINIKYEREVEIGAALNSEFEIVQEDATPVTRHRVSSGDTTNAEAEIAWVEL